MTRTRDEFRITTVPDPVVRELLENLGFGYSSGERRWVKCCGGEQTELVESLLRKRGIPFEKHPAPSGGELKRYPKLSDEMAVAGGGAEDRCGLCGKWENGCRKYVECDDADNPDYEDAATFWVCRRCRRDKIEPHPRLYMSFGEDD